MKIRNRPIQADVDYSGVYGGPPTRALFYEARRAFVRGEKDFIEIPVFGDRVFPDAKFFSDIFNPESCVSSGPPNISSFSDFKGVRDDSFTLSRENDAGDTVERDISFRRNVANLNDKGSEPDGLLPGSESTSSEPEDAAENIIFATHQRAGRGVSLATLLRTGSRDKGKLQSSSSFNGCLKAESMRKLLPRVTTRERHFHSFNSDFFCSSGNVLDANEEEENSNFEGSIVQEKLKKVRNKVLDGLSKTMSISSRMTTGTTATNRNRKTRRNSAMGCRFFDDVKFEDSNSIICEGKMKKTEGNETIKASSSLKTRVESNSHSTSKVSDSSISVDERRSKSPISTNFGEVTSDYDSDHGLYYVEELPDNGGSETEEMKIVEKVRSWSKGKEGNIRSLLSTLQFVLWSGSGWNPVRLVDIVEGNAVKKSYLKALLCLHPDKLQQKGALNSEKVTAQMVFDLLQEAWSHFNTLSLC